MSDVAYTDDLSDEEVHRRLVLFARSLHKRYPDRSFDDIFAICSDDLGPTLADCDVYGERIDTGERIEGLPIWHYTKYDIYICERSPGSSFLYRYAAGEDPDGPDIFIPA
jgi:hypothetical protein